MYIYCNSLILILLHVLTKFKVNYNNIIVKVKWGT